MRDIIIQKCFTRETRSGNFHLTIPFVIFYFIFNVNGIYRKDFDWGLYTIDTVIDRKESRQNSLFALTHFGDHALHHLFPTLDNAVLPYLYDSLFQTLREFESEARAYPFWELITGQFQQLARTEPMKNCSLKRVQAKERTADEKSI